MADLTTLRTLQGDEYRDFGDFLAELSDDGWERPSLCDGWAVRDVVAHLVSWDEHLVFSGARSLPSGVGRFLRDLGRARFSPETMNDAMLASWRERSVADLLTAFRQGTGDETRLPDRLAPGSHLAELVVHHQDCRRPAGASRQIPSERIVGALDALRSLPGVGARKRLRGLRAVATEATWSAGDGLEVEGPGEALLMAIAGRRPALDDLTGPGVAVLSQRM